MVSSLAMRLLADSLLPLHLLSLRSYVQQITQPVKLYAGTCDILLRTQTERHSHLRRHTLEYKNLGSSGLRVSVVGLGCNNFGRRCDQAATTAVVEKALDSGVTLFDTADVYGPRGLSEEFLVVALKGKRREATVAPKFLRPVGGGTPRSGTLDGRNRGAESGPVRLEAHRLPML